MQLLCNNFNVELHKSVICGTTCPSFWNFCLQSLFPRILFAVAKTKLVSRQNVIIKRNIYLFTCAAWLQSEIEVDKKKQSGLRCRCLIIP